jgi:hypothetical protein
LNRSDNVDRFHQSLLAHVARRTHFYWANQYWRAVVCDLAQLVSGIIVHRERLIIRLKSDNNTDDGSDSPDDMSLSIPWQKPPSRRSRQILLPHNASRSDVRPAQFERRSRLVSAIARGRRWLDDVVSGRATTIAELCDREKCSVRQANMTISLAFLAGFSVYGPQNLSGRLVVTEDGPKQGLDSRMIESLARRLFVN